MTGQADPVEVARGILENLREQIGRRLTRQEFELRFKRAPEANELESGFLIRVVGKLWPYLASLVLLAVSAAVAIVMGLLHDAVADAVRQVCFISSGVGATAAAFLVLWLVAGRAHYRSRAAHASNEVQRLEFEICSLSDATIAGPRVDKLLERLQAQMRLLDQQRIRDYLFGAAIISAVAGTVVVLIANSAKVAVAAVVIEILVTVAYTFSRNRNRQLEQAIVQTEYELSLLTVDPTPEQRAERLYLKQQFELKRYYDEALRQSASLSYIGAACVLGGFAVVGVAIALLTTKHPVAATQVVIISGIGGLLANFVAVVFLSMHSATVRSMSEFHNRLVGTNHVHMANTLISRMRHDRDGHPATKLNDSLAEVAIEIVRSGASATGKGEAGTGAPSPN